jgi:hypothetical protein
MRCNREGLLESRIRGAAMGVFSVRQVSWETNPLNSRARRSRLVAAGLLLAIPVLAAGHSAPTGRLPLDTSLGEKGLGGNSLTNFITPTRDADGRRIKRYNSESPIAVYGVVEAHEPGVTVKSVDVRLLRADGRVAWRKRVPLEQDGDEVSFEAKIPPRGDEEKTGSYYWVVVTPVTEPGPPVAFPGYIDDGPIPGSDVQVIHISGHNRSSLKTTKGATGGGPLMTTQRPRRFEFRIGLRALTALSGPPEPQ